MFKKTLIKCPKCELEGRTKTLGLIFSNGVISIQREFVPARGSDEPKRDYTIVQGRDFSLICGFCGEIVYRKEENYGTSTYGFIGTKMILSTYGIKSEAIGSIGPGTM